MLYLSDSRLEFEFENTERTKSLEVRPIHIACIVCGKADQALAFRKLLNSAILLSESPLRFHLVVESETKNNISQMVFDFKFSQSTQVIMSR